MSLAWKFRRLQAMGGAEVVFRIGRALQVAAQAAGKMIANLNQLSLLNYLPVG